MSAISIHGVSKSYGEVAVLRQIDLEIQSGEFIALVGPSGCGKSTLLRMIAGLEDISKGQIRIHDRVVNELAPRERDIAMVFQSYALYPHMSVADNMSFNLKLRRMLPDAIATALRSASEKLGLERLMQRKPRDLSGGQRQRVAMGRAIVRQPKAFLFDEPLSNLDARLRENMRYEIRKLHRQLGATSIYVTHDQIEAMTMADRIVAMHEGVIQQIGSPRDLYDNPANLFVAGFIGSPAMNFLRAQLLLEDGRQVVKIGGQHLCTLERALAAQQEQAVTVGIRPERLSLANAASGMQARVEQVETTGLGLVIHLELGGQPLQLFSTDRNAPADGAEAYVTVKPEDVLLFDPHSGVRLRPQDC